MAQLSMFDEPRTLRDIWREDAAPKPSPDVPEAGATADETSRRVPDPHTPEKPAATTAFGHP